MAAVKVKALRCALLVCIGLFHIGDVAAKPPVTFISLSYDDALPSQITHAVPALDKYGFKAAFYLVPANAGFNQYKKSWKALARNGHELGNHSYTHPCRGSLPEREWVESENDLDTMSVDEMKNQVIKSNRALQEIDGLMSRTYTIPCGDVLASGENYIPAIREYVFAIKGKTLQPGEEVIFAPVNMPASELIALVTNQPDEVRIINFIFHGVGGDYLTVSTAAHSSLLAFLDNNRDRYKVDTYMNIAKAFSSENNKFGE